MVTHSDSLAWRIPWTEEPGGLQSMGSQRVRHNGATNSDINVRLRLVPHGLCNYCEHSRGPRGDSQGLHAYQTLSPLVPSR